MIYKGIKDQYKADAIDLNIAAWIDDNYNLTRLKNDMEGTRIINIPVELLEIMQAYFEGKTIEVKETNYE